MFRSTSPFAKVPVTDGELDTLRLLIGASETVPHFWSLQVCTGNGARLVQELTEPDYYEQPLQQRLENAMHYGSNLFRVEVDVLKMALSRDRIPSLAINMTSALGDSLLHQVANGIATTRMLRNPHKGFLADLHGNDHLGSMEYKNLLVWCQEWQLLLEELISRGADLHPVSLHSKTPFLEFIQRIIDSAWVHEMYDVFTDQDLAFWCESLKRCGVSLKEYGAKETELHEQGHTCWDFRRRRRNDAKYRLTNFTYGDSLSDWSIHIEKQIDPVTEDLEQHVPGGWIEEATPA